MKTFLLEVGRSKGSCWNMAPECLEQVAKEIIREFDSDQEGYLYFQEFLNIFLPATNDDIRQQCIDRYNQN